VATTLRKAADNHPAVSCQMHENRDRTLAVPIPDRVLQRAVADSLGRSMPNRFLTSGQNMNG
jgi:hypothetical protein